MHSCIKQLKFEYTLIFYSVCDNLMTMGQLNYIETSSTQHSTACYVLLTRIAFKNSSYNSRKQKQAAVPQVNTTRY